MLTDPVGVFRFCVSLFFSFLSLGSGWLDRVTVTPKYTPPFAA